MLTQLEAEIDTNGVVRLLQPLKIARKSRAIVTIIDSQPTTKPKMTGEEARLAEERFARWIGSVNSGNPISADNDQIDADLAKEYGSTHDDE